MGRGGGNSSGAGGVATVNPVSAVSTSGNVTATANATGGNGAAGNDNAAGGTGGSTTLANVVSGTTTGNATLNQTAVGGNGGSGTAANGGAAGTSSASLTFVRASGRNDDVDDQFDRRQRRRFERRQSGGGRRGVHDESGPDGRQRGDGHANSHGRQWRRHCGQFARQWCRGRHGDRGRIVDDHGFSTARPRLQQLGAMAASVAAADLSAGQAAYRTSRRCRRFQPVAV